MARLVPEPAADGIAPGPGSVFEHHLIQRHQRLLPNSAYLVGKSPLSRFYAGGHLIASKRFVLKSTPNLGDSRVLGQPDFIFPFSESMSPCTGSGL